MVDGGLARSRNRHALWAAMLLATTAGTAAWSGPAWAQTTPERSFDIPAQSLPTALTIFGRQSGLQVSVPADLASGRASTAVSGRLVPLDALSRLLAGTGLVYRISGNIVTLEPAPRSAGGAIALGAVRVSGDGQGGAGIFSGNDSPTSDRAATEGTRSYTTRSMSTATRLPLSIRETPQSVSVVTRERMDDQAITDVNQALAQTTGVVAFVTLFDGGTFYSRGFPMNDIQIDGVPTGGTVENGSTNQLDMIMYDRVEVLRGASGLMQGAGNPGGVINLVRKRPGETLAYSASARLGSWNNLRLEADVGGPVTASGAVRARVAAAYDKGDSFVDLVYHKRLALYGLMEFDLGERTMLTVGGSYQRKRYLTNIYGLPSYSDGSFLPLDRSTYLGVAWSDGVSADTTSFAELSHDFGAGWTAKALVNATWSKAVGPQSYTIGVVDKVTGVSSSRTSIGQSDSSLPQVGADIYASGPIRLFGQEHELAFGVNGRTQTDKFFRHDCCTTSYPADPLNYDPYAIPEPDFGPVISRTDTKTERYGAFATIRLNPTDRLHLIVGGRINWYRNVNTSLVFSSGATTRTAYRDNGRVIPYVGAIVDLTSSVSAYASYTSIFSPQTNMNATGSLLPPIMGENYEAGLKGAFHDERLNLSLAYFRIDQTNRAITDLSVPFDPGNICQGYCYIASGKVRSEGVEMEVSGQVLRDWSVSGGYTYNRQKQIEIENVAQIGRPFSPLTPKHLVRLWSTYRIGPVKIGGGVNAQSATYGWSWNPVVRQSGYAIANALLSYELDSNFTLSANLNNLLDKHYYASLGGAAGGTYFGAPRNVMVSLRGRW